MGTVQTAGENRCIRVLEEKQSVRVGGAGANAGPVGQIRGGQNAKVSVGGRRQLELEIPVRAKAQRGQNGWGGRRRHNIVIPNDGIMIAPSEAGAAAGELKRGIHGRGARDRAGEVIQIGRASCRERV